MRTLPPAPPTPPPPASLPPPLGRLRRITRRINSLPGIAFTIIVGVIVFTYAYDIYQRNQEAIRMRQLHEGAPASADASGFLKDKDKGFIRPSRYERPEKQPVAEEKLETHKEEHKEEKPTDDTGEEPARKEAWKEYRKRWQQVRNEHFDKRFAALADLKTAQPIASEHAEGSKPAETQMATTPVSAPAGGAVGGAPGGTGSWWGAGGGGLPGFGGFYPGLGQTPQIDREGQQQKIGFANQKGDLGKDDYVPTVRKPADPLAVIAGTVVNYTTTNEVNSDVPGSQLGMVTADVYNNDGTCVLIPQFARLLGHYNSVVSVGQGRLPGVLTRINFPDGSHQSIGAMESADVAGSAGQEDLINRHILQKLSGVFVAALGGAAIQLGVPHNNNYNNGYDSTQIVGASLTQQLGQLGIQIGQQALSIPNTITIRAGYKATMITDKDIHIEPPWSCHGQRRGFGLPIMALDR